MSQKEIRLYEDSVIKLTVRQGYEAERFPITIGSGSFVKGEDLLDFDKINSISGALNSGELGYTRDTNRLFVGNISEDLNGKQQQTPGGVLTGNKYLGFVDSRDSALGENKPLSLDTLLSSDSLYRTYNFSDDEASSLIYTEDKKWQRLPYYNEKYDAYDGDYVYDIYRNAIVLFDHNISANNNPDFAEINGQEQLQHKMHGKRKTVLEPRFVDSVENNRGRETVYQHTSDMYGDGYVLFYNVIPDGDTLTFASKSFDENGIDKNEDGVNNYSYNIIKINRLPASLVGETLDPKHFQLSTTTEGGVIQLNSDWVSKFDGIPSNNFENAIDNHVVIVKKENNNIALSSSSVNIDDLTWISTNLNSDTFKETIKSNLLNDYYTAEEVDTQISTRISSIDTDINYEADIPVPDYSRPIAFTPNVVNIENLTNVLSDSTMDEDALNDLEEEIMSSNYFLLIGGVGIMTIQHRYSEAEAGTEGQNGAVSGTATLELGMANAYSQHLLPFKLSIENESITIGGNIASKYILTAK